MKITEMIPNDMPEWANDGIDSGQFFRVCLAKVKKLEQQVLELKEKAKAWDDLEALIGECSEERLTIAIKPDSDFKQFFLVDDIKKGGVYYCVDVFNKISVSRALEYIKENDNE